MDQKPLDLPMFYQSFLKVRQASVGPITIQEPSLVVLVGTAGSGKSTLAHKLFNKESIVSSDRCRELICWTGNPPDNLSSTEYWSKMQSVSNGAFQMMHKDLETLLSKGKIAVADATSLSLRARTALNFIAQKHGVPVTYIVNCVPENLCVERDVSRKFPVGASIIAKQMAMMEQTMQDLSGKDNVVFITPKTCDQLSINLVTSEGKAILPKEEPKVEVEHLKKNTVVVDLDGTLANIEHRLHYVQNSPPNWQAFFRECPKDTPNDWCVELIRSMLLVGKDVIVVSARSKEVEKESIEWVRNAILGKPGTEPLYLGKLDVQLVREEKDSTPDQILKKKWLDNFGKDRILFAVDDRQRVVQMWRDNGIVCLQCAYWEEKPRRK
jgi:predicted kinase